MSEVALSIGTLFDSTLALVLPLQPATKMAQVALTIGNVFYSTLALVLAHLPLF